MKNDPATNIACNKRKQTSEQKNGNSKVHMERIKSLKDSNDQEKIRTQRQDLFDNWEQVAEKHPTINQNHILKKERKYSSAN